MPGVRRRVTPARSHREMRPCTIIRQDTHRHRCPPRTATAPRGLLQPRARLLRRLSSRVRRVRAARARGFRSLALLESVRSRAAPPPLRAPQYVRVRMPSHMQRRETPRSRGVASMHADCCPAQWTCCGQRSRRASRRTRCPQCCQCSLMQCATPAHNSWRDSARRVSDHKHSNVVTSIDAAQWPTFAAADQGPDGFLGGELEAFGRAAMAWGSSTVWSAS